MMQEHEFAQYVRILGKGPSLSRPLDEAEMHRAATMVLTGQVEPIQLGAFLCLLRLTGETPSDLAGFARAAQETMPDPAALPGADLDWPCYAGKKRRLPWFLLAVLALADAGVRVALHGLEQHSAGRIWASEALSLFGITPAADASAARAQMEQRRLAFMELPMLHPALAGLMQQRHLLGLRSPVHSVVRHLNPGAAPAQLIGVAHPPYRPLHRDAGALLGQKRMVVLKGEGGEAERVPEKSCDLATLHDGAAEDIAWAPLLADPRREPGAALALAELPALWRGESENVVGEAAVIATLAVALFTLGEARDQRQAEDAARMMWQRRRVGAYAMEQVA